MITEQKQDNTLQEAVSAAVYWARTGKGYFSMRDKVETYLQTSTPAKEPGLWYDYNSRKLAMHNLMFKCINPLTSSQYLKLDHEVRDIAATLPETTVRHLRR